MGYYSKKERELYSIFEKFYVIELEWKEIRVLNETEFKKLQNNLASLEKEIVLIKNRQPSCAELLERYDSEYSKYSAEVERILDLNNQERYQVRRCLFSEEKIEALRKTIDSLVEIRNRNWELLDNRTIEYSSRILWHLISLRNDVDKSKSDIFQTLEKLRETLEKNNSILHELLSPTHDWITLEQQNKKRCVKCSKEIELEQIEQPTYSSEDIDEMALAKEEYRKKIQRIRDSEIL